MRDQKEKKIIPFYTAVPLFYIRTRSRTLRNNTIVPHTRSSFVNTNLCSVFVLRRNYHAHKVNVRLLRQIDQDTPERGRRPTVFFLPLIFFLCPGMMLPVVCAPGDRWSGFSNFRWFGSAARAHESQKFKEQYPIPSRRQRWGRRNKEQAQN